MKIFAEGEEESGEEDDQRLDQQMGDTGDQGEDVDERLWNGDDADEKEDGKRKEEESRPDEAPLQVDDASQLDYDQGKEEQPEDGEGKQPKDAQQPRQIDRPENEPAAEEDGEEEQDVQYEDRYYLLVLYLFRIISFIYMRQLNTSNYIDILTSFANFTIITDLKIEDLSNQKLQTKSLISLRTSTLMAMLTVMRNNRLSKMKSKSNL